MSDQAIDPNSVEEISATGTPDGFRLPADCSQNIRAMHEIWLAKRGIRPMPARADFDPVEMPPHLLPGICLVDVVSDWRRYVYRLVGTHDVKVRGFDPTGKSVLEAFFGPNAEESLRCYDHVVSRRTPYLDVEQFKSPFTHYVTDETLFLPLSDDGKSVNKILVFSESNYVYSCPVPPAAF